MTAGCICAASLVKFCVSMGGYCLREGVRQGFRVLCHTPYYWQVSGPARGEMRSNHRMPAPFLVQYLPKETRAMTEPTVKSISAEALLLRYQTEPDLFLLDVRSEEEWAERHIPGARLLPMYRLISRRAELDPARETVVLCERGVRSVSVALVLVARLGFANVAILQGGLSAWTGPLEAGR